MAAFFAAFLAVHLWWSAARFPRRRHSAAGRPAAHRRGPDPDGQPARPGARQSAVRGFRAGRGAGCVLLARAQRARLRAPVRQAQLRAAARQLRAFGAADSVRARPGHERRQGQPVRISAGGNHPHPAGVVPGRLFRHALGRAAARARTRGLALARSPRWFDIPPVEYTFPVLVCVALSLLFFFLQSDMGPALVFACLFLVLYWDGARERVGAAAGLVLLLAGFVVGYFLGVPHTVCERVSMWASPWNNLIHGGDQLAHRCGLTPPAAYRERARAGRSATGARRAHRSDSFGAGRRMGLRGRCRRCSRCMRFIVYRALRIALRARTDYEFFLAAGLARGHGAADPADRRRLAGSAAAFRRGDAVPELRPHRPCWPISLVIAMLVSISSRGGDAQRNAPFRAPLEAAGLVLRCAGADRRGARRLTCRCCAAARSWARAPWWCRPMARAATSTIRASRK